MNKSETLLKLMSKKHCENKRIPLIRNEWKVRRETQATLRFWSWAMGKRWYYRKQRRWTLVVGIYELWGSCRHWDEYVAQAIRSGITNQLTSSGSLLPSGTHSLTQGSLSCFSIILPRNMFTVRGKAQVRSSGRGQRKKPQRIDVYYSIYPINETYLLNNHHLTLKIINPPSLWKFGVCN